MAKNSAIMLLFFMLLSLLALLSNSQECKLIPNISLGTYHPGPVTEGDADLFDFALNIEYFEAEFFLGSLYEEGLDKFAPQLTGGGPPPRGLQKANLDSRTRDIVLQFALQEVGHIRYTLEGTEDDINPVSVQLWAGLLGVESGQDAVIRYWLYERSNEKVYPYSFTVAEVTEKISNLRNCLGKTGIVDEGVIVPKELGAEGRVSGNILSADPNSLSYSRTPAQTLRVLYATGNESIPGGFYPLGANGRIARSFLIP